MYLNGTQCSAQNESGRVPISTHQSAVMKSSLCTALSAMTYNKPSIPNPTSLSAKTRETSPAHTSSCHPSHPLPSQVRAQQTLG